MRYIGSKVTVAPKIFRLLSKSIKNGTFCDPFGGMSTIGLIFKKNGFNVYSGDILKFANCFQITKIEINNKLQFRKLKRYLGYSSEFKVEDYFNGSNNSEGWFVNEYAIKRKFFTLKNARKIQFCMNEIYKWKEAQLLNRREYAFLISSLINSLDKVANTAGTYYAYLKKFNRKSRKLFVYEVMEITKGRCNNKAYLLKAETLIKKNIMTSYI